ncbi:putative peroxisomal bioproteinsis protein peroxin [Operophtera brumata]|uniref:Putative peroxisomal bioproteinsis protein peroxin n=1 Tax=Operophtera brumata TaxID=104452 RepID=A0A0L7K3V6_OPEBR|nr:putative peroxisomal bioproteinsis protein peroxin [Operophtera brumata]
MTASTRLALTRSTLRLFDDAAALKVALSYGLGMQDGPIWGPIGVAGNLFTLAYLQAEKIGWLIDTGLLKVSEETEFKVKTSHKLFWSLYAFVGLVKSIRALHASAQLLKSRQRPRCAQARFTQASLTTTKLLLDVVHVVSWLPRGWLWGSALQTQHASGIATLAAIMGLVVHYNGMRLLPRK